jgi:predicted TIM-barrel fold metal-dependent hydrolase
VDYHQHLFSPAVTKLSPGLRSIDASDLIALLSSAGIRRALVFSVAYQFGNPNKSAIEDEYDQVKAENDWTSQQVARFPDRLRGFCSVNPLKDYAIKELARCAKDPQLHFGLKLHFGNSDVDLDNPQHVEQLRLVLRLANEHQMVIAVHMRASVTRKRPYGAAQARIFLNEILPAAPDVPVQIAHLAGAGGYDDPSVDEALAVFVDAIARQDPRMAHVYFDVSGVAGYGNGLRRRVSLPLGFDSLLLVASSTAPMVMAEVILRPAKLGEHFVNYLYPTPSFAPSGTTSPRICSDRSNPRWFRRDLLIASVIRETPYFRRMFGNLLPTQRLMAVAKSLNQPKRTRPHRKEPFSYKNHPSSLKIPSAKLK